MTVHDNHKEIRDSLKKWYLIHARQLPWRINTTVYGTWLSEVILQQTRMEVGVKKWQKIIASFPTVQHLAEAREDQILKAWEGLCLLYTSPSPRDRQKSRMPSSA